MNTDVPHNTIEACGNFFRMLFSRGTLVGSLAAFVFAISFPSFYSSHFYPSESAYRACVCTVFLVTAALIELGRPRRTISRSKPPGYCLRCGYDLRATPDRCPECGAVPMATSCAGMMPVIGRKDTHEPGTSDHLVRVPPDEV